jgi:hypothetical protein
MQPARPISPALDWLERNALPLALLVQALLLFSRLSLLPYWMDEAFTLQTVPQSLSRIQIILDRDIHPPLYFSILHFWQQLPLPGTPIARARAFSALWVLLATAAVDRLWLRTLAPRLRFRFLALWTLSPCLLLYGRMARSYSMQLFLGGITVYAACRFLEAPSSRRWLAAYTVAGTLLLYTHYAPGIAILAAVCVFAAVVSVRRRSPALAAPMLIAHALLGIAYLPWIFSIGKALSHWIGKSGTYLATGNLWAEQGLKLLQWAISFSFGETFAAGGMLLAALLAPFLLAALWGSWKPMEPWVWIAAAAAAIGYLGVGRWVTFPFVPARLLFLYPFFLMLVVRGLRPLDGPPRARNWRNWAFAGMLALSAGGVWAYFHREGFLNKGYNLPVDEMASLINRDGLAPDELIVLDTCNSDGLAFTNSLLNQGAVIKVSDASSAETIRAAAARSQIIWYWSNTHDLCAGQLNRRLEAEFSAGFNTERHLFVPYGWIERRFVKLLNWPDQPTHAYVLLEMRGRR